VVTFVYAGGSCYISADQNCDSACFQVEVIGGLSLTCYCLNIMNMVLHMDVLIIW